MPVLCGAESEKQTAVQVLATCYYVCVLLRPVPLNLTRVTKTLGQAPVQAALTLLHADDIENFEESWKHKSPWLFA